MLLLVLPSLLCLVPLKVVAKPGDTIHVDGDMKGIAPVALDVTVGLHRIEVSRPTFMPEQRWVVIGDAGATIELPLRYQRPSSAQPAWVVGQNQGMGKAAALPTFLTQLLAGARARADLEKRLEAKARAVTEKSGGRVDGMLTTQRFHSVQSDVAVEWAFSELASLPARVASDVAEPTIGGIGHYAARAAGAGTVPAQGIHTTGVSEAELGTSAFSRSNLDRPSGFNLIATPPFDKYAKPKAPEWMTHGSTKTVTVGVGCHDRLQSVADMLARVDAALQTRTHVALEKKEFADDREHHLSVDVHESQWFRVDLAKLEVSERYLMPDGTLCSMVRLPRDKIASWFKKNELGELVQVERFIADGKRKEAATALRRLAESLIVVHIVDQQQELSTDLRVHDSQQHKVTVLSGSYYWSLEVNWPRVTEVVHGIDAIRFKLPSGAMTSLHELESAQAAITE